jgi:3-hydroxyacyl-CoA dehydrogenase
MYYIFTKRPQDVPYLHFFSPANVMRLLKSCAGADRTRCVKLTSMQSFAETGSRRSLSGQMGGW